MRRGARLNSRQDKTSRDGASRERKRKEGGKKRERGGGGLVRIFPRVLTGPATNRATNNAVLCGSAALTRRPNTPAGPRQLFQQTTKQWTVAERY